MSWGSGFLLPPPPGALPFFGGWLGLGGARGTQRELGGARGSQKEPGEARGGGARGARGSQEEPGPPPNQPYTHPLPQGGGGGVPPPTPTGGAGGAHAHPGGGTNPGAHMWSPWPLPQGALAASRVPWAAPKVTSLAITHRGRLLVAAKDPGLFLAPLDLLGDIGGIDLCKGIKGTRGAHGGAIVRVHQGHRDAVLQGYYISAASVQSSQQHAYIYVYIYVRIYICVALTCSPCYVIILAQGIAADTF